MRRIEKPKFLVAEVLSDCVENMQDLILKKELLDAKTFFDRAESEFEDKKAANELYKIAQDQIVSDRIDSEFLKNMYTDRLVNKKNIGRKHYDNIILSAPGGKCPLCSQRIVRTIDHYLPKSKYPLLSVTPINLIPACSDCNKDKLADIPEKSEDETLHPYYDNVEGESWLKGRIKNLNPIVFEYFVLPPADWNELLKKRIIHHFNSFSLNKLYSIHASEEFENIKTQLIKVSNSGGKESLRAHLKDCFDSRFSANINSWQTAFYECLMQNDDFLEGGFI